MSASTEEEEDKFCVAEAGDYIAADVYMEEYGHIVELLLSRFLIRR